MNRRQFIKSIFVSIVAINISPHTFLSPSDTIYFNKCWYVDGKYGKDRNRGHTPNEAKRTIQAALQAAREGEFIFVRGKNKGEVGVIETK